MKQIKLGIVVFLSGMFLMIISCRKNFERLAPQSAASAVADAMVMAELSVTAVSSPAAGLNDVGHLVDGSLATSWTGDNAPNVYLPDPNSQVVTFRLDTTSMKNVAYIKMGFNTSGSSAIQYYFDVLVSQDGQTGWVNVLNNQHSTPNNASLQTYDFPDVKGRYVRIVGHGNNGSSPKTNSWTEVQIYGAVAPVTNSVKLPIAVNHVTANNFIPPYVPSNVIDGRLNTNWSSKMNGTTDFKNITVNLGADHVVDQVRLSFYTGGDPARVSRFGVFVSTDSISWTKVVSNTWSASNHYGERLESFDFPDVSAKFVRVECYGHTGTYSATTYNSINELEVDGAPIANNICKILSITQSDRRVLTDKRQGYFYYNAHSNLDSVSFNNKDFGFGDQEGVLWRYTYSSDNRLKTMTASPATGGPYSGLPYTMTTFEWKNGRIARETRNYVDLGAESVTYDSVAYDAKGRVAADYYLTISGDPPYTHYERRDTSYYRYNVNDNRDFGPSVYYDNKTSFLRTDSLLMYQFRNYSKNNPMPVAGYNSHGLPTGFPDDLNYHLPFTFFDATVITAFDYTCTE